ncbi:alanine racemase [Gorillibacterium massiliense]|uniref:alanine racemase n=1 Tax=Gorillibacterium massiliense TaxID=1280390 RepID=UPI0004AFD59D|nr:alanine racemase [Gorillibacterium massiliense]
MDSFYRQTRIEVSLDALKHNLQEFRRVLPDSVGMMAIVKADAYRHGSVEISKEALACGASYLGTAFLDEALELRRAGIDGPILVLGYTPVEGIAKAREYGITLNVYSEEILEALAEYREGEPLVKIHIKIDSGMGRLGLYEEEQAISFIDRALSLPGVEVEGLFTHYACADEADKTSVREQYRRFSRIVEHYRTKGVHFPYLHAGNSAAAIDTPELSYNMVRLGISMYGLYPSDEVDQEIVQLQPVMSLKTGISMLKTLPAGSGISYGHKYFTSRDEEKIATLPIGYADGYSRLLTGKAYALVRGQKVPVIGTICMDQCMIDVTDVPEIGLEDEVVMFGSQGEETISADDIARELGTINYEILCMISHRVPRVYIRGGEVVKTINLLQHY